MRKINMRENSPFWMFCWLKTERFPTPEAFVRFGRVWWFHIVKSSGQFRLGAFLPRLISAQTNNHQSLSFLFWLSLIWWIEWIFEYARLQMWPMQNVDHYGVVFDHHHRHHRMNANIWCWDIERTLTKGKQFNICVCVAHILSIRYLSPWLTICAQAKENSNAIVLTVECRREWSAIRMPCSMLIIHSKTMQKKVGQTNVRVLTLLVSLLPTTFVSYADSMRPMIFLYGLWSPPMVSWTFHKSAVE